jgi:hypothetical protein
VPVSSTVTAMEGEEDNHIHQKTEMKIIIIIVLLFVLVAGWFWFVLRSVTEDVSDKAPYSEMINQDVFTLKEMVLAKNLPEFKMKEKIFISEDTTLFEGVEKIAQLPINTEVKFSKVYEHTGGTSGITSILLIGIVRINSQDYEIEYQMSMPNYDFNVEKDSKKFRLKSEYKFNKLFSIPYAGKITPSS